jgi:hypothetical protein
MAYEIATVLVRDLDCPADPGCLQDRPHRHLWKEPRSNMSVWMSRRKKPELHDRRTRRLLFGGKAKLTPGALARGPRCPGSLGRRISSAREHNGPRCSTAQHVVSQILALPPNALDPSSSGKFVGSGAGRSHPFTASQRDRSHSNAPPSSPERRRLRLHPIVGMTNSASDRTPVGQRVVMVFSRV